MREPHCGLGVMAVDLETDEDDNADKHFEADLIVQMPEGVRSDLERVVDLEDLRFAFHPIWRSMGHTVRAGCW